MAPKIEEKYPSNARKDSSMTKIAQLSDFHLMISFRYINVLQKGLSSYTSLRGSPFSFCFWSNWVQQSIYRKIWKVNNWGGHYAQKPICSGLGWYFHFFSAKTCKLPNRWQFLLVWRGQVCRWLLLTFYKSGIWRKRFVLLIYSNTSACSAAFATWNCKYMNRLILLYQCSEKHLH